MDFIGWVRVVSIDISGELERMTKEFGLDAKNVATNFRTNVRNMWSDSIFKQSIYDNRMIVIENTNPRSKKRFPTKQRWRCECCGELFAKESTELDHAVGEFEMKSINHAEDFLRGIFFTSPKDLQILCKDVKEKKTVKGRKVATGYLLYIGCHSIKTLAERNGISFEDARIRKEVLNICKFESKVIDLLNENNVELPKFKKDYEAVVESIIRKKYAK